MFKLILLDFSMPDLNGPEVAKLIRQIVNEAGMEQPYICCCTAYTDPSYGKIAIEAGMDSVMTKPITSNELKQLLIEQNLHEL